MRVGIVGSRNFHDYEFLEKIILKHVDIDDIDIIVSGGAIGADRLGERFATIHKIPKDIKYPQWNTYGNSAGKLRNIKIVRNSDIIFAFWDGVSDGTKHTIELSKFHNKELIIQKFKGEYMNNVVLLDGNNIAHICFHSAQNIARRQKPENPETFLEGMTYHLFFNKIISFIKQFKSHYFITWDMKGSTDWRKSVNEDYKSNRTNNQDSYLLFNIMNNLRKILPSFPIYQYLQDGFEADDIIYQCVRDIHNYSNNITIISNDSDLLQIVQQYDNVKQFNPKKNKYMNAPEDYDIVIYKALAGDTSDKVSGVKGVGKTGAEKIAKLVYNKSWNETLKIISEQLKNNPDKIKQFKNSYNLVNIASNPNLIDIKINTNYLFDTKIFDKDSIIKFFNKYNMKTHLKNIDKTIELFNKIYDIKETK